jgi:hypothetical protein
MTLFALEYDASHTARSSIASTMNGMKVQFLRGGPPRFKSERRLK